MADGLMSSATAAVMAMATDMPDSDGSFNVTTTCDGGNEYGDEDLGVRISAIFVILIGSLLGGIFPILSQRSKTSLMPPIVFFIAKYFGSGVIIATAFIHLLAPANEALGNPCLGDSVFSEYPWAEGIALMTVFLLFFIELIVMRSGMFTNHTHDDDSGAVTQTKSNGAYSDDIDGLTDPTFQQNVRKSSVVTPQRGEDHLSHHRDHAEVNPTAEGGAVAPFDSDKPATVEDGHTHDVIHGSYDDYAAQMTAIFILEFGVIFHSIFIGLTLAVTAPGAEFNILYVVLVFHQTFEGLGLGTRLAITPWSKDRKGRITPYLLAVAYSLSTPIAIAIGLGVRTTFQPESYTGLVVNGIFDSISAGILLYTGLVELMAHEFMFSQTMQRAKTGIMLLAFFVMCLGAGIMALLGKWA